MTPYTIVLAFAETYWDNCSLGWSLVQFESFIINWCMLFCNWIFAVNLYSDFLSAACSQNQHMKHFQPSCFRISGVTQGWKRLNFQRQILLFHIMLARHVIEHFVLENIITFWSHRYCDDVLLPFSLGYLSHRYLFRQKSRLCCGRTLQSLGFF